MTEEELKKLVFRLERENASLKKLVRDRSDSYTPQQCIELDKLDYAHIEKTRKELGL